MPSTCRLALLHSVPDSLVDCQLTYIGPARIDIATARRQHNLYQAALESLGLEVQVVDDNALEPDAVFIEDTAIVLPELAISCPLGTPSRHVEAARIAPHLNKYRRVESIELPARLEGGDVLVMGRKVLVGRSSRTDQQGIDALANVLKPYDYQVQTVAVHGSLHLKTAVCALDEETFLVNPRWIEVDDLPPGRRMKIDEEEPFGANLLRVNDCICLPAHAPRTVEQVQAAGYDVRTIEISEFAKAEGGLTCLCLLF